MKEKVFPNGFQFVHSTSESDIPISCIYVFIDFGSIHLPSHLLGMSHFIEHMCFKGTSKHPNFETILAKYERMGAFFNAFSTERCTYFVLKCHDKHVSEAISILAEQLLTSDFDPVNLRTEKAVVENESRNYQDNPQNLLDMTTQRIVYKDTPFEFPVDYLAYHQRNNWNRKTIFELYKRYYQPHNMVCSVSSKLPFSKWITILKKTLFNAEQKTTPKDSLFKHLSANSILIDQKVTQGPLFSLVTLPHNNKLDTAVFNISFKTCTQFEFDDKYKLHFLANVLGNTQISRLFKLLRVQTGLVYSVSVSVDNNEFGGEFRIHTQCDAKNYAEVFSMVMKEIFSDVKRGRKITVAEIQTVKSYFENHMMMDIFGSCDTKTMHNGLNVLLYGDEDPSVEYESIYNRFFKPITKRDMDDVVARYLTKERLVVTCFIGNVKAAAEKREIEIKLNKLLSAYR